jgi:hypothetical protein
MCEICVIIEIHSLPGDLTKRFSQMELMPDQKLGYGGEII